MFDMPAADLIEQYQWVDYVYARREAGMGDGISTHRYRELNRGIRNDLLLDNRLPDGSKSIASLDTTQGTFLRLLQTHDRW